MSFEEFQDGLHDSHLGIWNEMILAIRNLYNFQMPPIILAQSDLRFGR